MSQASFSETEKLEGLPPCPPNASVSNQPNCADVLTRSQPLQINAARTWSPWKPAPGSNIPRKGTTFARMSWLALSMEDDFIINWLNLTPNLPRGLRLLALSPSPFSFLLFTLTKLRTSCLGTNRTVLQGFISRACCLQQRGRTECNSLHAALGALSHPRIGNYVWRDNTAWLPDCRDTELAESSMAWKQNIFFSWNIHRNQTLQMSVFGWTAFLFLF